MEYLRLRGEHDDVPRAELLRGFAEHYPHLPRLDAESFEADVAAEAGTRRH